MEHPQVTLERELRKKVSRHPEDRDAQVQLMALTGIIKLVRRLRVINPSLCYMTALDVVQDVALYGLPSKKDLPEEFITEHPFPGNITRAK